MKSQLPHIAPLGWEHISLTGDYVWTLLDGLKANFRPLPHRAVAVPAKWFNLNSSNYSMHYAS